VDFTSVGRLGRRNCNGTGTHSPRVLPEGPARTVPARRRPGYRCASGTIDALGDRAPHGPRTRARVSASRNPSVRKERVQTWQRGRLNGRGRGRAPVGVGGRGDAGAQGLVRAAAHEGASMNPEATPLPRGPAGTGGLSSTRQAYRPVRMVGLGPIASRTAAAKLPDCAQGGPKHPAPGGMRDAVVELQGRCSRGPRGVSFNPQLDLAGMSGRRGCAALPQTY